jgi:hypothetical protein
MNFKLFLLSAATMVNAAYGTTPVPVPFSLGTAGDFVILAKAGITNVPTSTITGDMGVSPIAGTSMTGFSLIMDTSNEFKTSSQVTGKIFAPGYASKTDVKMTTAANDMVTAYNNAAAVPVTTIVAELPNYFYINHGKPREVDDQDVETAPAGVAGELGGLTLTAGVYEFGVEVTIDDDLTFDAEDDSSSVFIIKTSKSVTQAGGTSVTLARGALAENIFWQVAETVEVGAGAKMVGTLLVWTSVTFNALSSLNGRILAGTAVTLDQTTITDPTYPQRRRGLRGLQVA